MWENIALSAVFNYSNLKMVVIVHIMSLRGSVREYCPITSTLLFQSQDGGNCTHYVAAGKCERILPRHQYFTIPISRWWKLYTLCPCGEMWENITPSPVFYYSNLKMVEIVHITSLPIPVVSFVLWVTNLLDLLKSTMVKTLMWWRKYKPIKFCCYKVTWFVITLNQYTHLKYFQKWNHCNFFKTT